MGREDIVVRGGRENNLRGVTLRIPLGQVTVVTGVSGSGKSSIVFDTVAVESQRQLNEVFPWFVRNRLPKYERPKFEFMENLTPAIIVDQKPVGGGSRSTVGTMTEVNPVLRVLFSRYGTPSAGFSHMYAFNDPQGMCPDCEGLGRTVRLDLGKLLDESRSLNEGAIRHPAFAVGTNYWKRYAQIRRYEGTGSGKSAGNNSAGSSTDTGTGRVSRSGGVLGQGPTVFDPDKPLRDYSPAERELLLYGGGFRTQRPADELGNVALNDYEGLVPRFTRRFLKPGLESLKERERKQAEKVVTEGACPTCEGARLNEGALASRIGGRNLADWCAMEISELIRVMAASEAAGDPAVGPVVAAALMALRRIEAVGLGYLSLDRPTRTLSGGEGQRLKTVRHLGSSLTGMTYIFDEPSVGLHARDVDRLNALLVALRDKGNTVLIVEHDREVIALADHVIDMGPGAGAHGGDVVFTGTVEKLAQSGTVTGRYFSERRGLKPARRRRRPTGALAVRDASFHNLRNVTVDFPTGVLTAVTGVAGSGKSTLVSHVFAARYPEAIVLDQSAVGISPRSTPATYTDIWDMVRRMYARQHGVDAGLFSFNSKGACPACQGRGSVTMDMAYMEPVTTVCEACEGRRFHAEVLGYRMDGRNVVDLLAMTVEQALEHFTDPAILRRLAPLSEVGLGYLTLGRPLSMLSGGERQRLKLAHRLHEKGSVYVFDEPTTGLHMADVETLLALLDRLVDAGNTVVVVEHDLDVVKHADHVIDIGPEAGEQGGRVVFAGTPEDMVRTSWTHTAEYLRRSLPTAG
ncbi:excinuclease ABC subunit UvrA [Streptomyces iconiensis]|uniref:UvrABC system protein A n=1 Tax=Streptomyces iconiensis TaxID=1384038 RepID=A0ABT7A4C2_9ACTN|nr:excinuclease ABC subunit UvrA [Streptomyces iconiensis]MDJ1136190.1 excinuclease ABC subunit UvrA [Streptomyces iconiensis]